MSSKLVRLARFTGLVLSLAATGSLAAERFDWMPAESVSDASRGQDGAGAEQIIPNITITPTPKPTADASRFTNVYQIELEKFGIRNDGTQPVETSMGINAALQHAKTVGATRIVFPAGTYLISETDPVVIDHHDTIIDLNGATLQINTNGLEKYSIVQFIDGARNVRLTNGNLKGDKDTHDYATVKGTHEWGAGITFIGGHNLEVDHLTITHLTGDGVGTNAVGNRNRPELLARIMHSVYAKDLESGGFSDRGDKTDVPGKVRSIKPYDITKCNGQFEIGYTMGYQGYPHAKGRVYQAYFYDADMKFLEMKKCLQYRKVQVPASAKFMHLEFNQPTIDGNADMGGTVVRITNFTPSTDVHFHHNELSRNRRLGFAYCGGQRWLIEENLFADNGGTAPAYGFDFEDGWELMQDVVLRKNTFRGNQAGDLVICAGSELLIEGNTFEKSVIVWGRPHNYVFTANRFTGGKVGYTTRTGVARIHGNQYENCTISIVFDTKAVADGLYREPGKTVATPPLLLENETLVNVKKITGTYFNFANSKLSNVSFTAGEETRLARFSNCRLEGTSILYEEKGPPVQLTVENGEGTLKEEGPGLARKQVK